MTPASVIAASLVLLAIILSWWAYSLLAIQRGTAEGKGGKPGVEEVSASLSVWPTKAPTHLVPVEVKDLPTTRF